MDSTLSRVAVCVATVAAAACLSLGCAQSGTDASTPSGDAGIAGGIDLMGGGTEGGVVAYVDGTPIMFEDVLREAQAELNQLELQRFRTVEATLDRLVARRLVSRAAAAEGVEAEAWLEREVARRVPQPTDEKIAEMIERYGRHPALSGRTAEEVRQVVIGELTKDDRRAAHLAIFEELRDAAEYESLLEPPRIDVRIPADAPSWGPQSAPVTVVGFSDFQCEFCRDSHEAVKRLLAEYGDRVRFVHRDFAIKEHPRAEPAARAAHCAGEQARYWDYHDVLWARPGRLSDTDLYDRAQSLALDMNQFRECFESGRYAAEVAADLQDGLRLGVSGTPTYFINGKVLSGAQTFESLRMIVEDELAEVGAEG